MPQLAKKNAWCSFVLKQNVLSGIFPEIRGMGNADNKQPGNRHELAFSRSHPRFGEWVVCLSLHACYMNACIRILACLYFIWTCTHSSTQSLTRTHCLQDTCASYRRNMAKNKHPWLQCFIGCLIGCFGGKKRSTNVCRSHVLCKWSYIHYVCVRERQYVWGWMVCVGGECTLKGRVISQAQRQQCFFSGKLRAGWVP